MSTWQSELHSCNNCSTHVQCMHAWSNFFSEIVLWLRDVVKSTQQSTSFVINYHLIGMTGIEQQRSSSKHWGSRDTRYVPDPKMDENFHIKSSKNGWLLYHMWNYPILDDFNHPNFNLLIIFHYWMFLIVSFWIKFIHNHDHPLLDVF